MSPYNCQEDTRLTAPGRAAPNSPISLNKGLAVSVKGYDDIIGDCDGGDLMRHQGASGVRMVEQDQASSHDLRDKEMDKRWPEFP